MLYGYVQLAGSMTFCRCDPRLCGEEALLEMASGGFNTLNCPGFLLLTPCWVSSFLHSTYHTVHTALSVLRRAEDKRLFAERSVGGFVGNSRLNGNEPMLPPVGPIVQSCAKQARLSSRV